jgi:RNA recognition motif-containing protein
MRQNDSAKVFVSCLPLQCNNQDLVELFQRTGYSVRHTKIVFNEEGTKSRMFGFVTLADDLEVVAACSALNGTRYRGRKIK